MGYGRLESVRLCLSPKLAPGVCDLSRRRPSVYLPSLSPGLLRRDSGNGLRRQNWHRRTKIELVRTPVNLVLMDDHPEIQSLRAIS